MEITKIKVVVELTVSSYRELTENDKKQIVDDLDYSFSFMEMLNGNHTSIIDTEILDTLEPE